MKQSIIIEVLIILFFGILSLYFALNGEVLESLISLVHGIALNLIFKAIQKTKK
jgi:hypothetical protein